MIVFIVNQTAVNLTEMLKRANITVWSSIKDIPTDATENFTLSALERVNALILEVSKPLPELQFVLAQAIILQRPTLCLYPKNSEPRQILNHLNKPNVPKCIIAKAYNNGSIEEVVNKFLQSLDKTIQLGEAPNIKFTLRLTGSLEHYLEWLAEEQRKNKADYIRKLIKEDAEKNTDYQNLFH